MGRASFTALLLVLLAAPASADSCDTLIGMAESALAAPNLPSSQRDQLQSLLEAGRSAKAAGDTQFCTSAMSSGPGRSPGPGGGRGHACEKSPNTV